MAVTVDGLKPGQKFPTPTPGFGDRVFYETLLRQRPDSAMAQEWCVSYGVLHANEAAKIHKVVMKRKNKAGGGVTPTKKAKKSGGSSKKKRVVSDVGYDADMQAGGSEGMGTAAL
mmetsp:Transcript_52073/g.156250  ORF Transcript_52073/g.156250 Transcript_52073/m.156250 type:complete len:115 (-) Transcript_52073:415-759(-)